MFKKSLEAFNGLKIIVGFYQSELIVCLEDVNRGFVCERVTPRDDVAVYSV